MKEIDKDQIRKEFEENDIHGLTPEQTEEMIDAFSANLQFVLSGMERLTKRPEPRERTVETMQAMKREINAFLETYKTYAAGQFILEPTVEFLRRALPHESENLFFAYMDMLGRDREKLYQLFNLNLFLEDVV